MRDLLPSRLTRRGLLVVLVVLATVSASRADGQTLPTVTLDSLVQSFADAKGLPSVVVGVSVGGERTVLSAGEVGGAAPDARTLYEIGSVSKVLTALALADAVARDEVTLETPVAELLPGWAVGAHAAGPIRLVDLATHRSGLARLPPNYLAGVTTVDDPYAAYTPELLALALQSVRPRTAPGEAYAYSNWGAGLLGYALARRAGQTYGELVTERVLRPLGLGETVLTVAPADTARFAVAHGPDGAPVPHWTWTEPTAGAGAWRSTAADMLTLAEAALDPSATPLTDAVALATAPRAQAGPGQIRLGWHLSKIAGTSVVWHNGMVGGSASFVGLAPEAGAAVVVLTNRQVSVDALAMEALLRTVAAQ